MVFVAVITMRIISSMKRISIVSLGTTGAGPVYSLEMTKALADLRRCELQIIISTGVTNLEKWKEAFVTRTDVEFYVIDTYKHTLSGVFKTMYFDRSKKENIVGLIKEFNADVLYIPFGFMWAPYVYKRLRTRLRIVITLHDPHPHDSFVDSFKWFVFRNLPGQKSMKYVDDIVILNNKDVDYVKHKTGKNVTVIPHASFDYYVHNISDDETIKNKVGFFGRIEPYKGLDLLMEAFGKQKNKDLKLLVAGSGIIDESVKSKILSNEKITLINRYIEDDEFQGLIDQIDFLVLPYKRASQSGVIPLAFAFGKTVVATNVGALEEQVPNDTGVIVAPDSDNIAKAIDDLYNNPKRIIELGANAKKYAQKELTWSHSAKLLLEYLEQTKLLMD